MFSVKHLLSRWDVIWTGHFTLLEIVRKYIRGWSKAENAMFVGEEWKAIALTATTETPDPHTGGGSLDFLIKRFGSRLWYRVAELFFNACIV